MLSTRNGYGDTVGATDAAVGLAGAGTFVDGIFVRVAVGGTNVLVGVADVTVCVAVGMGVVVGLGVLVGSGVGEAISA